MINLLGRLYQVIYLFIDGVVMVRGMRIVLPLKALTLEKQRK